MPRATGIALAGMTTALTLALAGCSTVAPIGPISAASTPASAGRGVRSYPTSPDLVDHARGALEDVGVHSIARRQEDRATILEGRTAAGRRAVATIRPDGAESFVSARFGTLGDEPLSRAFLDRMVARAGGPEPAKAESTKSESAGAEPAPRDAARRPAPNRASMPPGSVLQNSLEGGYRDSLSP